MEVEYYYTCKDKECRQKFGEVAKKEKDIEDVKCPTCNSEVSLDFINKGFRINFQSTGGLNTPYFKKENIL